MLRRSKSSTDTADNNIFVTSVENPEVGEEEPGEKKFVERVRLEEEKLVSEVLNQIKGSAEYCAIEGLSDRNLFLKDRVEKVKIKYRETVVQRLFDN